MTPQQFFSAHELPTVLAQLDQSTIHFINTERVFNENNLAPGEAYKLAVDLRDLLTHLHSTNKLVATEEKNQ